jgi:YD repeat-containing protein
MSSKKIRWLAVVGSMLIVGYTSATVSGTSAFGAPALASVSVTPDGSYGGQVTASTSGNTTVYTVTYNGGEFDDSEEFDLSCTATLGITCSVTQSIFLDPGESQNVTVTFSTSSQTGTGWLYLDADNQWVGSDQGSKYFSVVSPVDVTANSIPSSVLQYAEGDTAKYNVKNSFTSTKWFTFTCAWGGESCTAPASQNIGAGQTAVVSLLFDAGDVPASYNLKLTATTGTSSDSHEQSVSVTDYVSVTATAERTPVYAQPNTVYADTFDVRFPGQTAATFNLTVSCPGGGTQVRSCSVLGGTSKSIGDAPVAVAVQYTAGANGDTSAITLTATKASDSDVTASNTLDVVSTSQILLSVDDANHGMELDRSQCVNVSAGAGSIVCDDFQFVYPFTPVTRMNRTRQIGLIYNSGTRGAKGMIGANFVLPPGVTEPDSIKATLVTNGTTVRTQSYGSSTYAPGENTRIAFNWFWNGVPGNEQVPKYDVTIQPWSGGSPQTSVTTSGRVVSISNQYRFGRGWWIAGLEKLAVRGDTLIWQGGDASGGVYLKSGTKWVEQTRQRPDTIAQSGSTYIRELIGGGEVHFNSSGFQTKTLDRNGNETRFSHSVVLGWTRLSSVELPTPNGGADTIYKLSYNATTGGLDSVQVRSAAGGWDRFRVYSSKATWAPHIDSIVAPDGATTRFLQSYGLISQVQGPAGDSTVISYGYDRAQNVTVKTDGEPDIVLGYRASSTIGRETSGWRAPTPVEDVFSRFDGPLSGAADTTAFYVTAWGALRGIRDALGNETWIEREDASYPALPTRVRYPNGRAVDAVYQSDGLLDYSVDRATGALTDYAWNETLSQPDTITSPEGVRTVFTYDSDGNRLTQKVVGGGTTTYTYDSDGLVIRVKDALNHADTLVYDSLGNLQWQQTDIGHRTTFVRDYLGRVTQTASPIDATDSIYKTVTYDVMGRTTREKTTNDVDALWSEVQTTYDSFGRRIKVQAFGDTVAADSDSLSTGLQEWRYDGLSRVVWQQASDKVDSMVYDLAGRVTELHTDRGHTITMAYDVLGRLTKRVVPHVAYANQAGTLDSLPYPAYTPIANDSLVIAADSVLYTYDVMGNALTINNSYAQITRTYTLGGQLSSDRQALKNYGSGIFTTHVYDLSYSYDLDGRRVSLQHPTWLSAGTDRTNYAYDALGRITTITGPLGDSYGYAYDTDDRIEKRTFPAGGETLWTYDDDHRLTDHVIRIGNDTTLNNEVAYNKNGTVKSIDGDGTSDMTYSGLGAVGHSEGIAWEGDWKYEEFVQDPFGAQLRNVSIGGEIESDSSAFRNTLDIYTLQALARLVGARLVLRSSLQALPAGLVESLGAVA